MVCCCCDLETVCVQDSNTIKNHKKKKIQLASATVMEYDSNFGLVDYIIFGLTLLLSFVVGVYHAIRHRANLSSAEYLLASNLSWFPIFVSMTASFFSAVGVLGIPAHIYTSGITFGLHSFSFILPIILCAEVMTPIFRNLNLVSVNEYLELRFSRGVRYLGCIFFHLQYLLYLSVVLYAPSLALNYVAGVPLTVTIISTGLICTIYTALGGMRAVIWTDVFQGFVMIGGLITITIIGTFKVGSIKEVYDVAYQMNRLDISFSPDPKVYHSIWGILIGLTFPLLPVWCISQPVVQRVISAKDEKEAKKALYGSLVAIIFIMILLTMVALVIFAHYSECDLLCSNRISGNDQILPYFIVNELGHITGLPGLFTACIYSFALSTISSGLNGMSALFLEDIAKKVRPNMSDTSALQISRLTACIGGLFVTGFSFIVPKFGRYVIKLAIQFFGIIGGPYFALFALGIFTDRTNALGAYVGAFIGFIVGMGLAVGQMFYPPDQNLPPISIDGCRFINVTVDESTCSLTQASDDKIAMLFSVSYCWHGMIALLLACAIGYTASLFSSVHDSKYLQKNLIYDYNENFLLKKCFYKRNRKYKVPIKDEKQKLQDYNTTFSTL